MSDFRLYSVNWQDGMLITREHLRDQEKYFEELVKWHAAQAGDRYGLIRKSRSGRAALGLNLSVSGNRLQVEVARCQAITPDGSYIEIGDDKGEVIRGEGEIGETKIPVYIGVDAERKKQIGDPDPGEDFPRVPFLVNRYSVHVGTPPNMPDGNFLQVALLNVNGSDVTPSPDYYPPSLTLYADERLTEKASDFRNRMENLLSLSTRAFKAITASGTMAKESTSLQVAFRSTISTLVYHLTTTLDDFVVGPNAGHPLGMVIMFKKLFRVFSTLVSLHPGVSDYLNEKYFTKQGGMEIGRYMSSIEAFILTEYDHRNLGAHVQMIDTILETMRAVMAFLAQTKREALGEQAVATETLTYSGRTYRNKAYSTSRLERVGELSYVMIEVAEPSPVSDVVALMSKDLFGDAEWRSMQVRLGINDARGLGETDPVDVDTTSFGNKVALHPRDMLESASVRQVTLIFRGAPDPTKFGNLGKMDLIVYTL
jgi:hypothetical protein